MKCPDCSGVLIPIFYEEVNIYFCSACKGRLLNEQKLKRIEISRDESFERNKKYSKRRFSESTRLCPSCDIDMEKVTYGKFSPKVIDECPQCTNIWLDEGELEDIQVAYEMYADNINKGKKSPQVDHSQKTKSEEPRKQGFKCPKCSHEQVEANECIKCGIIFAKFNAARGAISINQEAGEMDSDHLIGSASKEKKTKKIGWMASTFLTREATEDLYRDKSSKKSTKRKTKKIEWVVLLVLVILFFLYEVNCQPQREQKGFFTGGKSRSQALIETAENDQCF